MVETLAKVISHFPGAANRARCTAHIINLVTKMILRQFDAKKTNGTTKKSNDTENNTNNEPNNTELVNDEDDLTGLAEGLNREEQEVADDEDEEMSENVEADLKDLEEALKEEVLEVAKLVKPLQRVLFKVRYSIIGQLGDFLLSFFNLFQLFTLLKY